MVSFIYNYFFWLVFTDFPPRFTPLLDDQQHPANCNLLQRGAIDTTPVWWSGVGRIFPEPEDD